jgi:hypothetical protein
MSAETFICGHPKSPENTRSLSGGKTACRECGRVSSRRWKERNREVNRARDRARKATPEQRGICSSPICTRLRGAGMAGKEGYCRECVRAVAEARRTLVEGMWADGWTHREMAEVFGVSRARTGIMIAQWRKRGFAEAFPHRLTPEQVQRIREGWARARAA